MINHDARHVAETAARVSYGRLLAILANHTRDIAAAEDALAEAFVAALRVWPERGTPASPDAWLFTAAKNSIKNAARHRQVQNAATAEIERRYEAASTAEPDFPDERLKMMFICAHPSIDEGVRTPLMLQTVLGLDAARIASAFLIAPAAMGQRLVRAKAKIRDAKLRFTVPEAEVLTERLTDVLNAVYAAYSAGWDAVAGADAGVRGLNEEAIYLGRVLVSLMPQEPEPRGLLALMLYCDARRIARRDAEGRFVPLNQQNAKLWSKDKIIEAEGLLTSAARFGQFGRFQCEAAIQSVHVQRPITGVTNYAALRTLYDLLYARAPSLGVIVGRAAVILEAGDAEAALAALDGAPKERMALYQPYWVTRARIAQALQRVPEAQAAFDTAIGLTEDEAIRSFLRESAAVGVVHPTGG